MVFNVPICVTDPQSSLLHSILVVFKIWYIDNPMPDSPRI